MIRTTHCIMVAGLFWIGADPVQADSPADPTGYTLSALIKRAIERSEATASLKARIEGQRHAAIQSEAWQNPSAGLLGGLKNEDGSGPVFELSLSQPVFYPGKQRLRREIGELEADGIRFDLAQTELLISHDVVRLAYEYVIGQRKKAVNEERQKRFELIRSYLAGHLFPSPQQKVERRIVETRLGNIATDALQIQGNVQSTFEKLNFYAGFEPSPPPEVEVPWLKGTGATAGSESRTGSGQEGRPGAVDKSRWLETSKKENFDLAAQKLRLDESRKEKDLAVLESKPDFEPSAFYSQETAGGTERTFGLGLAMPIPVLNRNLAGIRSSERKIESERRLLRYTEQQIEAQVGQLWSEYEVAVQAVRRYPDSLPRDLNSQVIEAEKEFRKGRLELLTFLELDAEATETNFRSLDAQFVLVDKLLSLLFLAGERDVVQYLSAQ